MSGAGSGFAWRHARREARASFRRLGAYMLTIALGVAALVSINSYRANAVRSVKSESRALLGADLRLSSNRLLPDSVLAAVDSLVATGKARQASVVSTLTVAVAPNGRSRLSQLRGVDGDYPFYGTLSTRPAGQWGNWNNGRVLVDPALLQQLDIQVGDSIRIGQRSFLVAAAITNLPPDLSFQNALGPRIFMGRSELESTGVMAFGTIAQYQLFLEIPAAAVLKSFIDTRHELLSRQQVRFETAEEQAESLAQALDALGRFLGLVGLTALLLGGLGVGSAVHVFVRDRRDTIAVLRCVGASRRTAFGAYLLQAVALGLGGAAVGVLAGVAIQFLLGPLLGNAVPFEIAPRLEWGIALTGLLLGGWVALVFALLPLLAVRSITPLRALRQEVEEPPARWRDPWHWAVLLLLLATIAGLSIWQTGQLWPGLAFTAALLVGLLLLWGCARLLVLATRRLFPRHARYEVRQGIANLYRPQNQTTTVTMAVGFGVFLITTLWVVQANLLGWLNVGGLEQQPNLVALDVQRDQLADVRTRLDAVAAYPAELVPIVPARIAAVNGVPAAELLERARARRDSARARRDSAAGARRGSASARRGAAGARRDSAAAGEARAGPTAAPPDSLRSHRGEPEPWALRREYRNTYQTELGSTERLVKGEWWPAAPAEPGVARVSAEEGVARSLGVDLGDHITWDFQGATVESVITSIRAVDWTRLETNFFFVFEPSVLANAPQSWVGLAKVDSAATRAALQRELVLAHPNVSVIDLATVQETLAGIIARVSLAIRFMALFSVFSGIVVLIAALAAGRFARVRETALLRTLGARDRQVRRILRTEYAALGALAGLTGSVLGGVAGFLMIHFVYHLEFRLPLLALLIAWATAIALALAIGSVLGRDALKRPPLASLREAAG